MNQLMTGSTRTHIIHSHPHNQTVKVRSTRVRSGATVGMNQKSTLLFRSLKNVIENEIPEV